MPTPTAPPATHPDLQQTLHRGRSEGFAIAALALGVLSFIQLLGTEKALLAIILASLALRGMPSPRSRKQGWTAIALGAAYIAITAISLILFRDQLAELIALLRSLG